MLLNGVNVFPLRVTFGRLVDYFMDAGGNVYSTKRGPLRALAGSRNGSGEIVYTLAGVSYSRRQLTKVAFAHADFKTETGGFGEAIAVAEAIDRKVGGAVVNGRTQNANQLVANKGYMIATVGPNSRLIFGSNPTFHVGESTVKAEAERIANLTPGTRVVILKVHASVVAGGVTWN